MEENSIRLRPNGQRAKTAIILIWIIFGIGILSLISSLLQYILLQKVANGEVVSASSADFNDIREIIIRILYSLAFIVSAVTFIRWFRRAYFNLHLLKKGLYQTEGWAAGAWFVPILNFFVPYKIMKELYKESNKLLINNNQLEQLKLGTVGWWWTLWITNWVVNRVLYFINKDVNTIDNMIHSTIASMVLNVIGIIMALITVKVIVDYAKIEPLLGAEIINHGDDSILDSDFINPE